jgi:hypothetical protein
MQWTSGENGGFSTAAQRRLTRPIPDGLFGPDRVNVADQRRDPASFWWFMRDLIRRYRQTPQIGWATVQVLDQPVRSVLAHACRVDGYPRMVALHNFGGDGCVVPLTVPDLPSGATLRGVVGDPVELTPHRGGDLEVTMDGYGYRWLRVCHPGDQWID